MRYCDCLFQGSTLFFKPIFAEVGMEVFLCNHRKQVGDQVYWFHWFEYVDVNAQPGYTPDENYNPSMDPCCSCSVMWYASTWGMRALFSRVPGTTAIHLAKDHTYMCRPARWLGALHHRVRLRCSYRRRERLWRDERRTTQDAVVIASWTAGRLPGI
jgi:hypothetical protein